MNSPLLDLPDELLETILAFVIADPWKNDVQDFLALTSTCRHLHRFVHENKYWQRMCRRRDPTRETRSDGAHCLAACKEGTWFDGEAAHRTL